jgi:hypothetical protein
VLNITQEKVTFAINLGDDYITLAGASSPDDAAAFVNYPRQTKYIFIDHLIDRQDSLSKNILTQIDGDQGFSTSDDNNIVSLWATL